jgi:hypothetical protein
MAVGALATALLDDLRAASARRCRDERNGAVVGHLGACVGVVGHVLLLGSLRGLLGVLLGLLYVL